MGLLTCLNLIYIRGTACLNSGQNQTRTKEKQVGTSISGMDLDPDPDRDLAHPKQPCPVSLRCCFIYESCRTLN